MPYERCSEPEETVRRTRVLGAPPDGLRQVVALTARVLDVPIAVATVIGSEQVWFRARRGLTVEWIPRPRGQCCSVVRRGAALGPGWGPGLGAAGLGAAGLACPPLDSAPGDPLFYDGYQPRFYAGAPLRTADGFEVGVLAVADREHRRLTRRQEEMFAALAGLAGREVEVRLVTREQVSDELAETAATRARVAALSGELSDRGRVGQALGLLMARRGCTAEQAVRLLGEISGRANLTVSETARELVADVERRARSGSR